MSDIDPNHAIDLSALTKKMKTSSHAAVAWSLQPTIFNVSVGGEVGMIPCIELVFQMDDGVTSSEPVAIAPDLIIGLIAGLSTWLSQIQGNPMAEVAEAGKAPKKAPVKPTSRTGAGS